MKIKGEGEFVSRPGQVRPPRLTVDEDYDLIGFERDPEVDRAMPDLTAETFDASRLWVATRAQQAFTSHHHTDAETAIDEIRSFAAVAISEGDYERRDNGFHRLRHKGFTVFITPDAKTATGYATMHYERTPSEVLAGVPSRFRKGGGGGPRHVPGPPKPLTELAVAFDPESVRVAWTALSLYGKRTGMDPEDDATEAAMRSELRRAAGAGEWRTSNRGPSAYVLETPTRHWIVAADDGAIITHYSPDSTETALKDG